MGLNEPNRAFVVVQSREPRLILEGDVPWLVDLCKRRYSNRYDSMASEAWFRNIVLKGPMIFLPVRTDNAFLIAEINGDEMYFNAVSRSGQVFDSGVITRRK